MLRKHLTKSNTPCERPNCGKLGPASNSHPKDPADPLKGIMSPPPSLSPPGAWDCQLHSLLHWRLELLRLRQLHLLLHVSVWCLGLFMTLQDKLQNVWRPHRTVLGPTFQEKLQDVWSLQSASAPDVHPFLCILLCPLKPSHFSLTVCL